MRRNHRFSRSGIAIVEFSLVVPLFLLLCLAAIDFGRVFRATMVLSGATRAGMSYAGSSSSASADTTGITNIVKTTAGSPTGIAVSTSSFCTCSRGGAQVACSNSCTGKASYVSVTTTLPFQTVMSWGVIPSSLTISTTAVSRIQ